MEAEFHKFLKRGGRSENAAGRIIAYVQEFENYLLEHRNHELLKANSDDLESFIALVEQQPKSSAKGLLWGLAYYFEFTSNDAMCHLAGFLRAQRIKRKPFPLREFRGLNLIDLDKLAAARIKHVDQLLAVGCTASGRAVLAKQTGVAETVILESVKLADLARIPGVKGIRARLYHDAGVDSIEKLAAWEPKALLEMVVDFVDRTGFEGIAPLPAEVSFSIAKAKQLPRFRTLLT